MRWIDGPGAEQTAQGRCEVMMRRMTLQDIPAVHKLERLCFSVPWSRGIFEQTAESGLDTFWVLEDDERLRGYACLRVIAGEGEIQRIGVHPFWRGRGYGRKLMEQMVIFARESGVAEMTLEVRAGNKKAIKLYESCGFVREGVRSGYYKDPAEDAVIMWNRRI